jgi:hypothetical protein
MFERMANVWHKQSQVADVCRKCKYYSLKSKGETTCYSYDCSEGIKIVHNYIPRKTIEELLKEGWKVIKSD